MNGMGFSRRFRTFLLWSARLAVFVYAMQLSAVDHLHIDPSNVTGIANTEFHSMHCHGASGGCADSAGFAGSGLARCAASAAMVPCGRRLRASRIVKLRATGSIMPARLFRNTDYVDVGQAISRGGDYLRTSKEDIEETCSAGDSSLQPAQPPWRRRRLCAR